VKAGVSVVVTFGGIIGLYLAVDAWAEDKITDSERRMITEQAELQAVNDINHSKIIQSQRITSSETNIEITNIKLEQLEDDIDARAEDGKDPTARQERTMNRLTSLLESYEEVNEDATTKLTTITTTTTTTTVTE
jgi:hypothetical protein